jgi:hypothetical protein
MNSFTSFQDHEVRKWIDRAERGMGVSENISRLVKQGQNIWKALPPLSAQTANSEVGRDFQRMVSKLLDAAAPQPGCWPNTNLCYNGLKTDVDREHGKRLKWLRLLFEGLEEVSNAPYWRSWLGFAQRSVDHSFNCPTFPFSNSLKHSKRQV